MIYLASHSIVLSANVLCYAIERGGSESMPCSFDENVHVVTRKIYSSVC